MNNWWCRNFVHRSKNVLRKITQSPEFRGSNFQDKIEWYKKLYAIVQTRNPIKGLRIYLSRGYCVFEELSWSDDIGFPYWIILLNVTLLSNHLLKGSFRQKICVKANWQTFSAHWRGLGKKKTLPLYRCRPCMDADNHSAVVRLLFPFTHWGARYFFAQEAPL